MKEKDLNGLSAEMKNMMQQTENVDEKMKQLQNDLHKIIATRTFEIFPFLPDASYIGKRNSRKFSTASLVDGSGWVVKRIS